MFRIILSFLFFISFFSSEGAFAQFGLEGISSGRYETKGSVYKIEKDESVGASSSAYKNKVNNTKVETSVGANKGTQFADEKSEYRKVSEPKVANRVQRTVASDIIEVKALEAPPMGINEDTKKIERKNRTKILSLDIRPSVIINESKSNYSYRDYKTVFSSIFVGGDVWFNRNLAVHGGMMFSLDADLDGNDANKSKVPAKYEHLDLGLKYKRFFGEGVGSQSLEFSGLYLDHGLNISSGSLLRAQLKSRGLGLGVVTNFVTSEKFSWSLGAKIFPKIIHTESNDGVPMESGSDPESSRLEFNVGTEWALDGGNSLVFRLDYALEKNLFDGQPVSLDPNTGLTPKNVGVENSFLGFSLGYRWGR